MGVKLSDEQRQALQQAAPSALPVEDDQSRKVYYLIDEQSYLHLEGLQSQHEQQCHEQLRGLIAEGIQSPEVPAQEAFARLRAAAVELCRSDP
jgi:hypothetical protein